MIKRITAAILAAISVILCFFSCASGSKGTLTIGVAALNGVFLPSCDMTDGDILLCDMIYSKLIETDSDGSVLCGDDVPSAARDFRVFYVDADLNESDEQTEYTAFEFVLKNGMKFSDGSDLTAEDVLFSLYYYLDPACGSGLLSSVSVVGAENYIYQRGDMSEFISLGTKILDKGVGYVPTEDDEFTAEQAQLFWNCFDSAGESFASNIVSYVKDNYCTDELVSTYIFDGYTVDDVTENTGLLTAYAMMLWNYGSFLYSYEASEYGEYVAALNSDGSYTYKTTLKKAMESDSYTEFVIDDNGEYYYESSSEEYLSIEDGEEYAKLYSKVLSDKYTVVSRTGVEGFRDISGKNYTLEDDSYPDDGDFFSAIKDYYTEDGVVDYKRLESTEAAFDGDTFCDKAELSFAQELAASTDQLFVKGFVGGKVSVDGEEYETVTVYLEGALYDSIDALGIYILSKEHMTKDFDQESDAIQAYGMPLNSESFAAHVKSIEAPLGSGPFVLDTSSESSDGVSLTASTQFHTMGNNEIFDPLTKNVRLLEVPAGEEVEMTESGEVDICLVPSGAKDISDKVNVIYSDYTSYDCIVINASVYININVRKALFSVMDTSMADGAAMSYSMPDFLWATPSGEREGLYDDSLESARSYFTAAGYTYSDDGELIDPATKKQASFIFTVLPTQTESTAAQIFEKAASNLISLGAQASVESNSDLMYDIYSDDGIAIYAMGWDIDRWAGLFDRYAISSGSEAVKACGIKALFENAVIDNFGTVEVTGADGESCSFNESDAASYLDTLLTEGRAELDFERKREIYSSALELISDLYFELPLSCRSKRILVSENVELESLYSEPSNLRSIVSEPWKIKLK